MHFSDWTLNKIHASAYFIHVSAGIFGMFRSCCCSTHYCHMNIYGQLTQFSFSLNISLCLPSLMHAFIFSSLLVAYNCTAGNLQKIIDFVVRISFLLWGSLSSLDLNLSPCHYCHHFFECAFCLFNPRCSWSSFSLLFHDCFIPVPFAHRAHLGTR